MPTGVAVDIVLLAAIRWVARRQRRGKSDALARGSGTEHGPAQRSGGLGLAEVCCDEGDARGADTLEGGEVQRVEAAAAGQVRHTVSLSRIEL